MIIIPSIDIQSGNCVRLTQGDFRKVSKYSLSPADVAAQFSDTGASVLHVVDLDGARSGAVSQKDCIKSIRKSFKQTVQVGGGIRSKNDIDELLGFSIDRVVIGSSAVLNTSSTLEWLETYGADTLVLALDFYLDDGMPYLAAKGWKEKTQRTVWEALELYPTLKHVLCTDISKDGMQAGPNFKFYQEMKERYPKVKIQASGGISSVQDILELKRLQIDAAIIGKALHEGKLDLKEIIACSR